MNAFANSWICVLNEIQYKQFIDYNMSNDVMYINYRDAFEYNLNDILFLCMRTKKTNQVELFGFCNFLGKRMTNSKIKIFDTAFENRFCSKINEITIFNKPVQLSELLSNRTVVFTNKFIKGDLIIKKIDFVHGALLKALVHKYKSEVDDNVESDKNSDTGSDTEQNENSDTGSDTEQDENSDEKSNIENKSNSDTMDDKSYVSINDPDHINGNVPILIELCDNFKFPNTKYDVNKFTKMKNPDITNKCIYFTEHYQKCRKCNVVNNNMFELTNILLNPNNTTITEFNDKTKDAVILSDAIEKYQNKLKFDIFGYTIDITCVNILYINDKKELYNNCLLICITNSV